MSDEKRVPVKSCEAIHGIIKSRDYYRVIYAALAKIGYLDPFWVASTDLNRSAHILLLPEKQKESGSGMHKILSIHQNDPNEDDLYTAIIMAVVEAGGVDKLPMAPRAIAERAVKILSTY